MEPCKYTCIIPPTRQPSIDSGVLPSNSRKAAVELIVHFFTLPLELFFIPDFVQNVDFQKDWKRAILAVVVCQICGPFIFILMLFMGFLGLYLAIVQIVEPFLMRHKCLKRPLRQIFEELSVLMFEDDVIDDLSHGFVEIPDGANIHIPGPSVSTDQFTTFQHPSNTELHTSASENMREISVLIDTILPLNTMDRENSISRATQEESSVDSTDTHPEVQEKIPKQELAQQFLSSSYQLTEERHRRQSEELASPKRQEIAHLQDSKVVKTQRKKIIDAASLVSTFFEYESLLTPRRT